MAGIETGTSLEGVRDSWSSSGDEGTPWRLHVSQFRRQHASSRPSAPPCNWRLHKFLNLFGFESGVDNFYHRQEQMLDGFTEMDNITKHGYVPSTSPEERESTRKGERFAIKISNIANMALFIVKIFASIKSGSLAIIASTLDSLLDLLSGFILWFTARKMRSPNPYLYPIGKKRMQPVGILVFASVMATLGLLIISESVQRLVSQDHALDLTGSNRAWVLSIMVGASVVKLGLMLYCRTFSNEIVRAYALDHFFDVITNVIGLIAAVLASIFFWWIDPVGAIVVLDVYAGLLAMVLQLALYTIRTWSLAVRENVNSLASKTAEPDYLQKLTYLCWNHHQDILKIDTVRAYTFGEHYFAEVDIVLPGHMQLDQAHDIGESLQNKLESLPEIERAFVHLDYEVSHRPEHATSDYK